MINPYSDLSWGYQQAAEWVSREPDEPCALFSLGFALMFEFIREAPE